MKLKTAVWFGVLSVGIDCALSIFWIVDASDAGRELPVRYMIAEFAHVAGAALMMLFFLGLLKNVK